MLGRGEAVTYCPLEVGLCVCRGGRLRPPKFPGQPGHVPVTVRTPGLPLAFAGQGSGRPRTGPGITLTYTISRNP
eukprot:scaffold306_cov525-Prasinococcus_capsulatus_cf.AAC.29